MHMRHYAVTGILALSAGLSACDGGGDPTSTGSTNPPAIQDEQSPSQALPVSPDDPNTPPANDTGSGG